MTREDSNHVESTTTDRRDYLRILLALAGVGALSTSTTEVAKAAHNSDAPYPSGAWGYAGTAGHGESERPSIAELEAAWNETYHVLHQDVDVGSRWYAEDGYSEWDFLHSAWDGLEFPGDTEYPAAAVTVQQDTNNNRFRLLGINNDGTLRRVATLDWTESLASGATQLLFETATNHDNAIAEKNVHHEQPTGTDWAAADVVEKGYPSFDEGGTSLEAYWPLDEDSGTTANDVSANGNDGTITGATVGQTPAPFGNSSYEFDGIDDFVSVPRITAIEDTTAVTVSAWVNFPVRDNFNSQAIYMWQSSSSSFDNYAELRFNEGNDTWLAHVETNGTGAAAESTDVNEPTGWQHLAFTFDSGTLRLYEDGTEVDNDTTGPTKTPIGDSGHDIGRSPFDQWYWEGFISDVRLYSRALSASEIQEAYEAAL